MGNIPTKEARTKSNSFSGGSGTSALESNSIRGSRRYTTNSIFNNHSHDLKKLKRREEKDKQREAHYFDLVVRYKENVDGGFLAPFGTYKGNLDFDTEIVRGLIIERRLAPFYTPLADFDESWSDKELLIIVSQLTLHSIETAYSDEEVDDMDDHKLRKSHNFYKRLEQKEKLKQLIERVKKAQKLEENEFMEAKLNAKKKGADRPPELSSDDLLLKLYRKATECPICFLYYPPHLNVSRCCLQPICTECFVQIKRLDPHPPHEDPSNHETSSSSSDPLPQELISETAKCPFCAMPEFGVTYDPDDSIKVGMGGILPGMFVNSDSEPDNLSTKCDSSDKSIKRRLPRKMSVAASSPMVITTDQIRPDWEQKLLSARNKMARSAANATAIHASNLLIDDNPPDVSSRRRFSSFDRSNGDSVSSAEARMIEEALRLSLLDEEERKKKIQLEERKKKA